jgi:hypothetical protein
MKAKVNAWIGSSVGVKFVLRSFMLINNRTHVSVIKDKEKYEYSRFKRKPELLTE